MALFERGGLASLLDEFRASMRGLLFDLCEDLETHYREPVAALRLPLGFFRFLGDSLKPTDYAHWKVVGWIEELNDLLYFMDLREQLRRERTPGEFAADLFDECQEKFFENSYRDELFPNGMPESAGLMKRLSGLCTRLARQVSQESLFLIPGLPCAWLASMPRRSKRVAWRVPCHLGPNFERAELPGRVYLGLDGGYLDPPPSLRKPVSDGSCGATFFVRPHGIQLHVGGKPYPLLSCRDGHHWGWTHVLPCYLRSPGSDWPNGLMLGAALVYRKDLSPWRVVPPPVSLMDRIGRALDVLERAWPVGARLLGLLTSRIVPLQARGVVSFSYRHRPGLSFLNTFERDRFDLIDDLVHENSHHQLNLLLRKHDMRRGDHNREIFYSPWRRSLRPLHGILHATFTFTMGAILFERLSSWAGDGRHGRMETAWFGERDVLRARFRCLEEVASVRYSIRDLSHAAERLGWLSPAGAALVRTLAGQIARVRRRIHPVRSHVLRSHYGSAIRRHERELEGARATYRLPRV
jgi:HEXXH motif-containing protein